VSRQLHAQAVIDRLKAAPGTPAAEVYDGKVPDNITPPPQYYVVRFGFRKLTGTESPGTTSLTMDSVTYQVDVTVHCVGTDARSTRGVATRAEAQLLNWRPTVAGRTCTRLKQIESTTLPPNESMGVSVEQQSDVYRFLSQPA
jgi:hypothetical protein